MYKNIFIETVRYFNILPSFLKALSSKGLSYIYVIIISLKADKSSKFVCLEQIIEYWSDDSIKTKFPKLWDLSGYSERTMSKRPTYQKWVFRGKLSLRC